MVTTVLTAAKTTVPVDGSDDDSGDDNSEDDSEADDQIEVEMEGMGFSFYFGLCSCLILSLSRSRNPLFRFSRVCDFFIRPHFRLIGLRDLKGTRGCSLRDLPRRRSFKHPDSPCTEITPC